MKGQHTQGMCECRVAMQLYPSEYMGEENPGQRGKKRPQKQNPKNWEINKIRGQKTNKNVHKKPSKKVVEERDAPLPLGKQHHKKTKIREINKIIGQKNKQNLQKTKK